jgi:hypothetical protein
MCMKNEQLKLYVWALQCMYLKYLCMVVFELTKYRIVPQVITEKEITLKPRMESERQNSGYTRFNKTKSSLVQYSILFHLHTVSAIKYLMSESRVLCHFPLFIPPSLDGTYYGTVMSVHPSVQGFLLTISFSFHISN